MGKLRRPAEAAVAPVEHPRQLLHAMVHGLVSSRVSGLAGSPVWVCSRALMKAVFCSAMAGLCSW